ncbi:MAG: hypothetical protein H7239_07300 [Flavobacterium sp.]|nr:hypothetical protein [Flavobacterium sp.]
MKIKSILLILFTVCLLSCKNDNKENNKQEVKEVAQNIFKVSINVIAKKNDDFCLLYTEDGSINFTKGSIWQNLKGSENEQQVVFYLPKDAYPTQLRIDFGVNKEQGDIVLKAIVCEYNGKKKEIRGNDLGLLFRPDETKCTYDSATGLIKAISKNGQKQSPSFYPQEANLGPELKKLAK